MATIKSGSRLVVAAVVMIIVGQLLAIANDLILRQSDPPDVVMLVVLIALSVFLLRGAGWARWTTIVLVALGGVLEVVGFVLLVGTRADPGFWSRIETAAPFLGTLHTAVVAFTTAHAFSLLAGSVLITALFDLAAVGLLAFAPSVRAEFSPRAATSGD